MFKNQLGDTMKVYINDMLVSPKKANDYIHHILEAFDVLQKYGMKLNPMKSTFGVDVGKFLGYVVTQRGIEETPD